MTDNYHDLPTETSHSETDRILARRAETLAKVRAEPDAAGDEIAVATFKLAEELYGIELSYTREIYPIKEITHLPGVPGFIAGIVNVRGEIFSAVDLKYFFEIHDHSATTTKHIIIIQSERMAFGILADEVLGVHYISPSSLQHHISTFTGIRSKYLKGIAEGRVVVLDAKRLLDDPGMYIYQEPS